MGALRKTMKGESGDKLFADEGQKVNLQVTGIKLPKDGRKHVLRM